MDLVRSLVAVLTLALLSPATFSFRFELQSGHTKCILEDIQENVMSFGKYSIVNPNEGSALPPSHKITVTVHSPKMTSYHHATDVTSGQFAYTSMESGDYITCLSAVEHKPETTLTVDFEWRTGVHAKDWTNVAKKSQVQTMEYEIKQLFDTVKSIHDEMFYLREREEEMQDLNRATNSKMAWLSFLSLGVALSVAALQVWHLKHFFEKKKLI